MALNVDAMIAILTMGWGDRKSKDKYVLYSAFDFEDSPIEVKVFYGDVTKRIGYVEVRNADEDE